MIIISITYGLKNLDNMLLLLLFDFDLESVSLEGEGWKERVNLLFSWREEGREGRDGWKSSPLGLKVDPFMISARIQEISHFRFEIYILPFKNIVN